MAAAATSAGAPRIHSSPIALRHLHPNGMENAIHIRKNAFASDPGVRTASSGCRPLVLAASKSPNEGANSNADDPDNPFEIQEDDVNFLLKLAAGSVVGAAAIKYGSILVPQITRPNITQALVMISAPVVVAVLLLIKQSRTT